MKSENLVALAAAHGTDFERAAKMASSEKPTPDVVPGKTKGSRVLVPPPKNQVKGSETRSFLRPEWTIQEIGMAAAELPEAPFKAALYAYAGAHEHRAFLHRELTGRGKMFARLYHWPDTVPDIWDVEAPYIPHLAMMILYEDANQNHFRVMPELYAFFMRVTPTIWEKRLQPYYAELGWAWRDMLGHAARMIQSKLSEHEE